MKKSTIIIINVVVSVLATLIVISLNTGGRHGYENAIMFALLCTGVLILQLVVNFGFSIYFFVKKNNEMGKFFLLSMLVVFLVALISFSLVGLISFK